MDAFEDRPHRISLEQIAQTVGVSKATVCRALLGRSRVSEATRERVKTAARELGYRPDPALSALTRYRWTAKEAKQTGFQIALIRVRGPDASVYRKAQINTSPSVTGIRTRCAELGLGYSEWVMEEEHSPAHLGRVLYNRGVLGIIINIEGPVAEWDFPWHHFVSVTLGHDRDTHHTHSIVPDWFRAITLAVTRAREAGGRRIGFCSFYRRNPEIDDLLGAAISRNRQKLKADYGPQPSIFTYPRDERNIRDCYQPESRRFWSWYQRERPDVIIDTNRFAYWWLRDHGISPPDEVGYITTVGQPRGDELNLSSVSLRREQQGYRAVELLFNLLQLNQRGLPEIPVRMVVACGWVPGRTLRPEVGANLPGP